MPRRYVALDLEFMRCRGGVYAWAAALVPFAPARDTTPSRERAVSEGGAPPTRTTLLPPATVVSLRPAAVMTEAAVLPCGHALHSAVTSDVVGGERLAALKQRFVPAARADWEAFRERRAREREARRAAWAASSSPETTAAADDDDADEAEIDVGDDGAAAESVATGTTATSDATRQKARLQKTLALVEHVSGLDPFTVPNVRLADARALQALADAPPASADYAAALATLQPLLAYGAGKGSRKSPLTLARFHPPLLQALLRESFGGGEAWVAWLRRCADLAEADMNAVAARHRCLPRAELLLRETDTLEEFSDALNAEWAGLLRAPPPTPGPPSRRRAGPQLRVLTYGNADGAVLRRTLHHSCQRHTREGVSERARQAGRWLSGAAARDGDAPRTALIAAPDRLLSPMQARVHDITGHALFGAAGFRGPLGRKPLGLAAALHLAAAKDATALRLEAAAQPHDPLWDAQALACVSSVSGIAA